MKDMLTDLKMMSVNQTAAQIKLTEMWKVVNDTSYPLKFQMKSEEKRGMGTRSCTRGDVVEFGSSTHTINSFCGSASRLWNKAPENIKKAATLKTAKKEINKYCTSLPI